MASHPKVRRFPKQRGSTYEFSRVETAFVQEDVVDGMECVKLRCRRWYYDHRPPAIQFLWLAGDRDYLCVKAQVFYDEQTTEQPNVESQAKDLREIAPGLWLPMRIDVKYFQRRAPGLAEPVVQRSASLVVEKVVAEPEYPASHFHDVEIPDGLSVFKIDRDGYLENGPLRPGQNELPDQKELARVIAAVREQEKLYERLDVTLRDFWAEWCGPCRQDLKKLREVDAMLAKTGITVIGVHPTGSPTEEVLRVAKEFGLDYPIYVDAAQPGGDHAWGKLFGQFAVHAIPHAFVIDQKGNIVAHGRLDQMIPRATQLVEK